ncbi:MAG: acyltransferase [Cocleimonas sp.]
MIKPLITWVIHKYKNPQFKFDKAVSSTLILELLLLRAIGRFRSLKLLFRFKCPGHIYLGKGVSLFNIRNIHFGRFVTLGNFCHLSGLGYNGVVIGNRVSLGDFSRLVVSTSFNNIGEGITLHDDVAIGEFAYIGGAGGAVIGRACIIGQYFSIHPENHVFTDMTQDIRDQGVHREGVTIGENCWIGSKVTILDGAKIGNGCVIAAGAVVRGTFPDNVIIAGVPARIIKQRDCE